ncbi:MAG: hypothetical protein ACYS8X_13820, partial [Planctomycetota bacterium]
AKRELTGDEQARLAAYRERAKQNQPVKVKKCDDSDKPGAVMPEDPDDPLLCAKMAEAIGSTDPDVQGLLLDQAVKTFRGVFYSDDVNRDRMVGATNQALALLSEIRPRDEIEAMLAAQMIGAHNMAMEAMGRAALTDQTFAGRESNVNHATRMMRTFLAQVETLKRYRDGGQGRMTVGQVNVNDGGQAIVGTVNQNARPKPENR